MSGICFYSRACDGLHAHACTGVSVLHDSPGCQKCSSLQSTAPRFPNDGKYKTVFPMDRNLPEHVTKLNDNDHTDVRCFL